MNNKKDEEKAWEMHDARNDARNFEGACQEEYDRLFSELSEEDKKKYLGKKIYWTDGMFLLPNGSVVEEES